MPSIRKRIGYLPKVSIQGIITKIANKEKLSQSKVVGILVEEALTARGIFAIKNRNNLICNSNYSCENIIDSSSINHSDLDELISDKGVIYNRKKYKQNSEDSLTASREDYNDELFKQFKQFMLFQKMIEDK